MSAGPPTSRLHVRAASRAGTAARADRRRVAVRLGVVGLFAALLLLKAALPWFADLAAARRGLSAGEVCSVYGYGVAHAGTGVDVGGTRSAHGAPGSSDPMPTGGLHGDATCPLTAFAPLGSAPGTLHGLPPALAPPVLEGALDSTPLPVADATADWRARRQHAPPRRSLG